MDCCKEEKCCPCADRIECLQAQIDQLKEMDRKLKIDIFKCFISDIGMRSSDDATQDFCTYLIGLKLSEMSIEEVKSIDTPKNADCEQVLELLIQRLLTI